MLKVEDILTFKRLKNTRNGFASEALCVEWGKPQRLQQDGQSEVRLHKEMLMLLEDKKN